MAFIDVYGLETATVVDSAEGNVTSEECASAVQALLPPGAAWTRDPDTNLTKLLRALSYEFARVRRRGRELLLELDPRLSYEMLADFERNFGIPNAFTKAPPESLEDRRDALTKYVRGFPDPTPANFKQIALDLGYGVIDLTFRDRTTPFRCTSPCNYAMWGRFWIFVWDVAALPSGGELLESAFDELAPSHTLVRFNFDPMAWSLVDSTLAVAFNDVADLNGLWIAVGGSIGANPAKLYTSPDGVTWTSRTSFTGNSETLYAVATDVVRDTPAAGICGTDGNIKWSSNGTAWVASPGSPGGGHTLEGLTSGDPYWIAVESTLIWRKAVIGDFDTVWQSTASPVSNLHDVAYGAGVYVAVGDTGGLVRSTDGVSWVDYTITGASDLMAVSYGGGLWVTVSNLGEVYTSHDGITWTKRDSGFTDTLYDVHVGADRYCIAVGFGGQTIVSAGGTHWTTIDTGNGLDLFGIGRRSNGAQSWVAVGDYSGTSNFVTFARS